MLNDTKSGAGSRGATPPLVLRLLVVVVLTVSLLLERTSFKRVKSTVREKNCCGGFAWQERSQG